MQLGKILHDLPTLSDYHKEVEITSVELDSRKVRVGSLFIALSGKNSDGKNYIPDVVKKGALAVVYDGDYDPPAEYSHVAFIRLDGNMKENTALIATNFYTGVPKLISAITGTNGKTSIADFTRQMMSSLDVKSASIGTLGVVSDGYDNVETLTTPDSVTLHQILSDLAEKGIDYVSMEASSIGVEQYRLDGIDIKVAGFTNFTQDHLDYHKTMEEYLRCKELLFTRVMNSKGTVVLNADIPEYEELKNACNERCLKVISYGYKGETLKIISRIPHTEGQSLDVEFMGNPYIFELPLVGAFQAMNALCAIGMVIALSNAQIESIINTAINLKGAPGRLDLVGKLPNGATVYVDYAHTPDALENVLKTIRNHTAKDLWVVFGCGGDRDKLKRPIMGAIAAEFADKVVVTDDNPRTEDAATIRDEVTTTCADAINIGDRAKAIEYAISNLQAGDMLVIAGKGHEDYQIIGKEKIHLSDHEEAVKAINHLEMKL